MSERGVVGHTVADVIVTRLGAYTDHVFGVGGANIEDLYDAVQRRPDLLTGIVAKHEFGAATMADGYARATNRLGVVAATSGGGAMNLLAALTESYDSRVPVLALVGQAPTGLEGRGAFQDTSGGMGRLDARQIFGAVSRYCVKVARPQHIHAEIERAVEAALGGGPAVLLLPKDIQAAIAPGGSWPVHREADPVPMPWQVDVRAAGQLAEAAELVAAAAGQGPAVIIAGPEIARADARAELAALAVALDATVLVTPDAKDAFPNRHPRFAGVTGIMGHPHAPDLIATAAVCVLAGTPLTMTARAGLDTALAACPRVLHLGTDEPFVPVRVRVPGSLRRRLLELSARATRPGFGAAQSNRQPLPELQPPPAHGPGIRYRDAVRAVSARLEPGTDVVADAGNTGAAVVHHLPVPDGGRFLIALGMGGMGYSFGAGIGSALGRGRRTFVIAGDGAYFMHGHEVHTAVEYQAPVTFVIFNNNAHAMCVTREQLYYTGDYSYNRFRPARIGAGVAAMFPQLPAYTAATLDELENALDKTRDDAGPVFIEILCDPDELPPFAPFLKEPLA
ncbi:thiamine pyrophosphate-binding protein [Nocardia sp. NBC_01503]|uniref:thiamine pyrophosphate-binding protein n=1 Tax=Nocardia sp. NBC_01503 TaxID=2975997 RepID=UPI002E7BF6A8|nr:thiamine pyrophosphate-binding protein [Nocardia sp. NBC_01503]WTL33522.1 thiamine pyrophosphate-binding protein [Nocardia sp. NBC_01503]